MTERHIFNMQWSENQRRTLEWADVCTPSERAKAKPPGVDGDAGNQIGAKGTRL